MAPHDVHRMQHWIDHSARFMRVRTGLITLLGIIALLLGVVGTYGVIAQSVAQRSREFGIRVALGERPAALPVALMTSALREASVGIVIGLIGAGLARTWARRPLYEVHVWDFATLVSVCVLVLLVAGTAAYVPARRAASADPLTVLHAE
jgi:putative ABC transport system permease protein